MTIAINDVEALNVVEDFIRSSTQKATRLTSPSTRRALRPRWPGRPKPRATRAKPNNRAALLFVQSYVVRYASRATSA
jgi:hypothetical protein